jgi:2-polyprenyl-3-methyl-5-hydroxy-6-metoxy-1,4-benzoquinol methylase
MSLSSSEYAEITERFAIRPSSRWMMDELIAMLDLPDYSRVLDIGCGTGVGMWQMCAHGLEPTGLDVNPASIDSARKKCLPAFLFNGHSVPNNVNLNFDAVVFTNTLNHVSSPASLLLEAYKALRPGGQLGIINPNLWHRRAMYWANRRTGYKGDETIRQEFTPRSLRRLVRDMFDNITVEMHGPKKFGRSPYFIMVARKAWR